MKRTGRSPSGKSLRSTDGFTAFVLDQLTDLRDVTARSMFGGVGLYAGELFFGIIARDVLYLKVDDATRPAFEAAGARAFAPYPDRPGTMQYYEVPVAVLESAVDLVRWARNAIAAAARAKARAHRPKPQARSRRRPTPAHESRKNEK